MEEMDSRVEMENLGKMRLRMKMLEYEFIALIRPIKLTQDSLEKMEVMEDRMFIVRCVEILSAKLYYQQG